MYRLIGCFYGTRAHALLSDIKNKMVQNSRTQLNTYNRTRQNESSKEIIKYTPRNKAAV